MTSWLRVRGDEIDMLVAAAVGRYVWCYWRGKVEALRRCAYYITKPRRTKFHVCEKCGKDGFRPNEIHVHHIIPRIPLTGWDTLEGFIRRTLCEADQLLCVCKSCHKKIHENDQLERSTNRKKPKSRKAKPTSKKKRGKKK